MGGYPMVGRHPPTGVRAAAPGPTSLCAGGREFRQDPLPSGVGGPTIHAPRPAQLWRPPSARDHA
eukprot:2131827-Alexandrium_andersonii.AAC.1